MSQKSTLLFFGMVLLLTGIFSIFLEWDVNGLKFVLNQLQYWGYPEGVLRTLKYFYIYINNEINLYLEGIYYFCDIKA